MPHSLLFKQYALLSNIMSGDQSDRMLPELVALSGCKSEDELHELAYNGNFRLFTNIYLACKDSTYKLNNEYYTCHTCLFTYPRDYFHTLDDPHNRFSVGDVYTDAECPQCEGLSYPLEMGTILTTVLEHTDKITLAAFSLIEKERLSSFSVDDYFLLSKTDFLDIAKECLKKLNIDGGNPLFLPIARLITFMIVSIIRQSEE